MMDRFFKKIIFIAVDRRLVSSMASLHVDLERERQGAENLQREVRSYVSRVQQVETMLAQKVIPISIAVHLIAEFMTMRSNESVDQIINVLRRFSRMKRELLCFNSFKR